MNTVTNVKLFDQVICIRKFNFLFLINDSLFDSPSFFTCWHAQVQHSNQRFINVLLHSVFNFLPEYVRVTLRWAEPPAETRRTPWQKDATLQHTDPTCVHGCLKPRERRPWGRHPSWKKDLAISIIHVGWNNETKPQPSQIATPRLLVGFFLISCTCSRERFFVGKTTSSDPVLFFA